MLDLSKNKWYIISAFEGKDLKKEKNKKNQKKPWLRERKYDILNAFRKGMEWSLKTEQNVNSQN